MQGVSSEVVAAFSAIGRPMESVREYVTATVTAVEEQSSVSRNVSANMQKAANAVESVNTNMVQISVAIEQAGQAIGRTREAATVLAR